MKSNRDVFFRESCVCLFTCQHITDITPVSQRIWTPTKTLLNSGSGTRNKCELTHQFTFWNGDIHCLSFRAMQKEVTSFLNLGQLRFSTKRSPRGKVLYFVNRYSFSLLFRWKKETFRSHYRLLVFLVSSGFFYFH